jgi:hypothetical protein
MRSWEFPAKRADVLIQFPGGREASREYSRDSSDRMRHHNAIGTDFGSIER